MATIYMGTPDTTCSSSDIIPLISCVLTRLINETEKLNNSNNTYSTTPFHSSTLSLITIEQYLLRISNYLVCSGECFILMLIYIDRIIQYNPDFLINYYSIHRLLLSGLIIAAKFHDEQYFNNAQYAHVGGVKLQELNMLESLFLYYIRFDLNLNLEQSYALYYQEIASHSTKCGCVFNTCELNDLVMNNNGSKYLLRRRESENSSHSSISSIGVSGINTSMELESDEEF